MSLREDVSAGLVALGGNLPVTLDGNGTATVPVPLLPSIVKLANNRILVQVQVARTGDFFTLSTPLAELRSKPSQLLLSALLHRHMTAPQTSGLTFALNADEDGLFALYHWILKTISPEDFRALFQRFTTSTLDLLDEVNEVARRDSSVTPVHEGHT